MELKWLLNYGQMDMRSKDGPAFEWYTAQWWVISLHVHNRTPDGSWRYRISGSAIGNVTGLSLLICWDRPAKDDYGTTRGLHHPI
jgi:hypothetical protein